MLGAIIGDTAGSIYEPKDRRIKTKDFPFFSEDCHFTDDSVCTAAVADALLHNLAPAETMRDWGQRYPRCGFSQIFKQWIASPEDAPNCTFRNGAAMRVSPAAFLNRGDLNGALLAAEKVTVISHDHPEGVKGARATTHAIWLAYQGENADAIREVIATEYSYDLTQTVDNIRPNYVFDMTCQGTVPPAVTCALESESYEDAVRNAISLGGDSDTLGSIAGAIAEALHGIPEDIQEEAESRYLAKAPDIIELMREMYRIVGN
jgi:ADP-ribosylglycohydrolase